VELPVRALPCIAVAFFAGCGAYYPPAVTPAVQDGGNTQTCPRDLPASCPADAPGYDGGVSIVVQDNCLMCHSPGGVSQDIPLGTYAQLYGRRTDVLGQVYNCLMPQAPKPPLPAADRKALLGWLVCGAPND
jgi:hypothetical protein